MARMLRQGILQEDVQASLDSDLKELIISYSPGPQGKDCADSASMKFGTDGDKYILNQFFEDAGAGAHWGCHTGLSKMATNR